MQSMYLNKCCDPSSAGQHFASNDCVVHCCMHFWCAIKARRTCQVLLMARFRSGWANLWLEFKWIIEIHRIQWILSTCLWPGGLFSPLRISSVYFFLCAPTESHAHRHKKDGVIESKMKMEYFPKRNESKMQVDYFAAITVFCDFHFVLTFGLCVR